MTVDATRSPFGLSIAFHVVVDGLDLGDWSGCSGLDVTAKLQRMHNPGDYSTELILFADTTYPNVRLERAINKGSHLVRRWVADRLDYYRQPAWNPIGRLVGGETAVITLLDATRSEVTTWNLRNVYPVSLKGPTMSANKHAIATETLEIAHEGFL